MIMKNVKPPKQPWLTDTEDVLEKKLTGFQKSFNRWTFGPVMFGQLIRLIVKAFIPEVVDIRRTKWMLAFLMLSPREGKSGYNTYIGSSEKDWQRLIVKTCKYNVKSNIFEMFSKSDAAATEPELPKCSNGSYLYDLWNGQIEVACLKLEKRADMATVKRRSSTRYHCTGSGPYSIAPHLWMPHRNVCFCS